MLTQAVLRTKVPILCVIFVQLAYLTTERHARDDTAIATIIKGKNVRKPYTVRYWVNGKQRERSFATARLANDFKSKVEYEARTQTFIDPKLADVRFVPYAEDVIKTMAIAANTRRIYYSVLRNWIAPWAKDRSLRKVAEDREGAITLFNVTMAHLSYSQRSITKAALMGVVEEAIRAGRLQNHRLSDIGLAHPDEVEDKKGFVFPSYELVSQLAEDLSMYGPVVWLMRGCGLRISEALAVHREDFRDGGKVLRAQAQSAGSGDRRAALKARKPGEYRDIPVPSYLWDMVKDKTRGPLCATPEGKYHSYSVVYKAFVRSRDRLGIDPDFTPHSLRHAFASALLGNLVPVTDVANWLGHKDISTTYKTYHHLIPSAASRARSVLDNEFKDWSKAS